MRKSLHPGSSIAALTVALCAVPQPVQANGFLGTPTVQSGNVTFDRVPLNSETITIDSSRAIINWVPDDNTGTAPFTFLPNGNSVNYVASTAQQSTGPYVVLNRILPSDTTRAAIFDGLITDVTGGNGIWFYTPGGFIIGNNARFNVGNTVLSTGDFTESAGEFFPGSSSFSVSNVAGSTAAIQINPGAQFNATAENSFVVAVAPRIAQNGAITVNGSAALVAAEAVDFTITGELFDIVVTQGTDTGASAFQHNGSTVGPASLGAGDHHRIYMVAVPKNNALTMAIGAGGTIGFDVANAADIDGNTIVLSAGHNVTATVSGGVPPFVDQPVNPVLADINIADTSFTSNVQARANGNLRAYGNTVAGLTAASDFTARGAVTVDIATFTGGTLVIDGNLTASADAVTGLTGGAARTGGLAQVHADTGTIVVGGDVTISANGNGDISTGGAGGAGTGGNATLFTGGGTIAIGGNAILAANGVGGDSANGAGAAGTGGTASIFANGGPIAITGSIDVSANALGGTVNGGVSAGGVGQGGTASLAALNSSLTVDGTTVVSAIGTGGGKTNVFDAATGNGIGGTARIQAQLNGSIVLDSDSFVSPMALAAPTV